MSFASARITNVAGTSQFFSLETTTGGTSSKVTSTPSGVACEPVPLGVIPPTSSYAETLLHIKETHTQIMSFFDVWQKVGNEPATSAAAEVDMDGLADAVEEDDFDGFEAELPGGNDNERTAGDKSSRQ